MNDMAVAVFSAAFDAVLNEHEGRDLSAEILARAGWLQDPLQIQGIRSMQIQSDGRVFGRPHLDRLREAFLLK